MQAPENFTRIVGGLKYTTRTATLIASDCWFDGHNWERHGRNTWLYRTPNGAFFTVTLSQWQGERDRLEPVSQEQAIQLFETDLIAHEVSYEEAFPGTEVRDA